jgi:parallel beta-helix repeat protein
MAAVLGMVVALALVLGGLPGSASAASTIYVDGVTGADMNPGTMAAPKKTIQAGVNTAVAGDTVQVAAATYEELVVVNKSVTLDGAGASQSIIRAPNGSTSISAVVTLTGAGVSTEISGFTITRPATTGTVGYGVVVRDGAYANIHDNSILDIRDQPASGGQYGNGIQVGRMAWSTTGTATITNNVISGYQKTGIVVDNAGSNANITGNTIVGDGPIAYIAENGIQISRGATATVTGNTISGHSYTPYTYTSAGILLYEAGATTVSDNTLTENQIGVSFYDASPVVISGNEFNATSAGTGSPGFWGIFVSDAQTKAMTVDINGNTFTSDNIAGGTAVGAAAGFGPFAIDLGVNGNIISNWQYGVWLECNTTCGAGFSSLLVNNNSIVGNTNGVKNDMGTVVNAENNWWGHASGPGPVGTGSGDPVSVNVDYDPWLMTSPLPTKVNLTSTDQLVCGPNSAALSVDFSNVPNLYGYEFKVNYDATKAGATGAFVNGWFNTTNALTPWPATCGGGACQFAASFQDDGDPLTPPISVSGGGTVATINFASVAPGTFNATITDVVLTDVDGFTIPYTSDAASLSFDVCGQASVSGVVTLQGRLTPMDAGQVKLIDQGGNFPDIVVPFNATTGAFSVPSIPVMPAGSNYQIQATHILYVGTQKTENLTPGEVLTNQNTKLWGGDADNSGLNAPFTTGVEVSDLACIGSAFGGPPGACGSNPGNSTDINKDLVTNIQDLAMAGGNYGRNPYQPW